ESIMASPSGNVEKMQTMAEELKSSLDVAGHALPMSLFASDQAQPAEIEMGTIIERREPEPTPAPVEPEPQIISEPEPTAKVVASQPEVESVPLPTESVPLPTVDSVPLPSQDEPVEETGFKNEVEVDHAAQDAFAGAFGSQLVPEPEVVPKPVEEVVPEPVVEEHPEEEWVSDAERFIAADVDDSGSLSVEELAVAADLTIEEAEELHTAADTDGDGEVSLSEFVSSEAAQKMSSLPRPVAPVRRPIQSQQPAQQQPAQQPVRQQPTSPGVAAPQMGWQQPLPQQQPMRQPMQQPMMPQQPTMNIQPTIRSGIHCRGCGIGLDPNWRFCPICGNMNMSAHR
ncbi:MAG: EF-hand domain-containing protein, partial [Candidatus Thermoplasmatota archaeon]|nr:EF-hand domain-containing protein [Candidatus Thermoplasmatota archaeon]